MARLRNAERASRFLESLCPASLHCARIGNGALRQLSAEVSPAMPPLATIARISSGPCGESRRLCPGLGAMQQVQVGSVVSFRYCCDRWPQAILTTSLRFCHPLLRRRPRSWSLAIDAIAERDPSACLLFLRALPRDCALTG